MKEYKITQVRNENSLVEVRLFSMSDLIEISNMLEKPILHAEDFSKRDLHNFKVSKTFSYKAVIDGNVVYKYVYDVKPDEVEDEEGNKTDY